MKDRILYLDNLKGFAIILVVLGHCIQLTDIHFDSNIIFRYIYSFHMPLFMFISGFVSYKANLSTGFIGKRFKQLVVPFVSWTIFKAIMEMDYMLLWQTIVSPDNSLWFLLVLFEIDVLLYVCYIISHKYNLSIDVPIILTILLCFLLRFIIDVNYLGVQSVSKFFIYFSSGLLFAKYYTFVPKVNIIPLSAICIAFFYLASFWMRTEPPTFMSSHPNGKIWFIYSILVSFLGIFSSFFLFKEKIAFKAQFLNYLGQITLGIYAIHFFVLPFSIAIVNNLIENVSYFVSVTLVFFLTIAVTCLIHRFIKLNKVSSFLLLGK